MRGWCWPPLSPGRSGLSPLAVNAIGFLNFAYEFDVPLSCLRGCKGFLPPRFGCGFFDRS